METPGPLLRPLSQGDRDRDVYLAVSVIDEQGRWKTCGYSEVIKPKVRILYYYFKCLYF